MVVNLQTSKNTGLAPLFAWPLLCLAMVLTGMVFNIESHEMPWAWPAPDGLQIESRWIALMAGTTGSLAVIITGLAIFQSRRKGQFGTWLEWLSLHLLVFSSIWLILPSSISTARYWVLGTALLAGTLVLATRSSHAPAGAPTRYFFSRAHALSDSLFIAVPLLAGYWALQGFVPQAGGGTIFYSIVLYPLYALFQMSIFLLIPAVRMQKMGYSSHSIAISCAVVFSLLHWPNPLLMAATGLAMLIWARQFLGGRSILALALVMGLAATGVKFMVPQPWSWEMRIGPDYIEKRAQDATDIRI